MPFILMQLFVRYEPDPIQRQAGNDNFDLVLREATASARKPPISTLPTQLLPSDLTARSRNANKGSLGTSYHGRVPGDPHLFDRRRSPGDRGARLR